MNFAGFVGRHRRSLLFVFVALTAAGIVSVTQLPMALFPHVDFPRIVVALDAGDRPADRMTIEVTRPVEEALRGVPGVRRVRSATSRGSAEVSVSFDWGSDMGSALLMTESAINRLVGSLPQGTTYETRRMDPTVFPVLAYSLTSNTLPATKLYDLAQDQLRPAIATIQGVGHVGILGGRREEYRVTVNPARLAAYGLDTSDVTNAIRASNVVLAVGRIEDLHKLYLVVAQAEAKDLESLGNIVVRTGGDGVVLVEDVATVSREVEPDWTRVNADGRPAVLMQVYQQPTGDTVAVAQAVRALIDQERKRLPRDLRVEPWYDQSELIVASTASVREAVCIGVALACLVMFLFLRSLRITLVALIAVPGVLAVTGLLLGVLGMSLNIMTLGGMAAAVGLIIDDVIVMIEFVEARRSAAPAERPSVLVAAGELTRPLLASSSATVIVFAPLGFLSGVTGAFFKALALTMASSLVISFFFAWVLVPILAERLLLDAAHDRHARGRLEQRVLSGYQWLAMRAIGSPVRSLLLLLPLLAAGWLSFGVLGSGFMPSMDEGGFILDYRAASGTSLAETDLLCRKVEAILSKTPEVRSYSRRTGSQLGGGLTEANEGDFFVRLQPVRQRGVEEVMDEVRSKVETTVPGLEVEMAQLMEDLIGDLTAVPQPIEVELFGEDPAALVASAQALAKSVGKIPGVVDVLPGIVLAGDALRLEVDDVRAALEGMDPAAVSNAALAQLDGEVATYVQQDPKIVGVRVWVPSALRKTIRDVEQLHLRAPDGHLFPLSRVATVTRVAGEPQITRDDLRRMIAVTGRISGRDMGSVMQDVQRLLDAPGTLPKEVSYRIGGLYAEQQKAFGGLAAVFVAAVALVFGLLLFVYESVRIASAMVLTTLLSLAAVLIGLAVTGTELNISSMMGMTMVVGIVTEVAIFYVSDYRGGSLEPGIDPLVRAGRDRLRPIAMTTLAAILALLPLALALGQGASMQQPLAIAIISGLFVQIPLVLVILPVLLRVFRITHTSAQLAPDPLS